MVAAKTDDCDLVAMGVLEDFGHRRLEGFRTSPLPFVVVYAEYEGRPAPALPTRFKGSVREALTEWVFGVDASGKGSFKGSVVDFFDRQLGITLQPVGGQRIWSVSMSTAEYVEAGQVISGARLRGLVKTKLEVALRSERVYLSLLDVDRDNLVEAPSGEDVGPGVAGPPEILVLALDNLGGKGGQTGGTDPAEVEVRRPEGEPGQPPRVHWTGEVSGLGASSGVMSMCHELLHQFGTVDLYGAGFGRNSRVTTMAAVPSDPDVRVRLDPWHELQLGVVTPVVADLTAPGSVRLEHAGGDPSRRLLLLVDPKRRFEGFLVQLRVGPQDPIDVDGPAGWCLWHASLEAPWGKRMLVLSRTVPGGWDASINMLGFPDLERGGSQAWPVSTAAATTPELRWWNGSETGFSITVVADPDGLGGTVSWQPEPTSWRYRGFAPAVTVAGTTPCWSSPVVAHDPSSGWPVVAALDSAQRMRPSLVIDEQSISPWGWPEGVAAATDVAMCTRFDGIVSAFTMSSGRILVDYPAWFASPSEIPAPGIQGRVGVTVWDERVVIAWSDGNRLWVAERTRGDIQWRREVVSMAEGFPSPLAGTGPSLASTVLGGGACFLAWTGTDRTVRILRRGNSGAWDDRFTIDFGVRVPAVLPVEGGYSTSETPAMALGLDDAIWFAVRTAQEPTRLAYGRAPAALGVIERFGRMWDPVWRQVDLGPISGPVSIAPCADGLRVAWVPNLGDPASLATLPIV